jgi:hypothetical protein
VQLGWQRKATTAKAPLQQRQQCKCNNVDGAIATIVTTPAQQLQRGLHDKGNNTITTMATTLEQQGQ